MRLRAVDRLRKAAGRSFSSSAASGVITVFFALISVIFLAVLLMLVESARVQGARAMCADYTDCGNMSLFGEYEKKLLEKYDVFAVDGSYGSGDFSIGRVNGKLSGYMNDSLSVPETSIAVFAFDPWKLDLQDTKITGYALLSDRGGENFYQQAVAYMKETAVTGMAAKLYAWYSDSEKARDKQDTYQKEKNNADKEMEGLKKQEAQKRAEQKAKGEAAHSQAEKDGTVPELPVPSQPQEKVENPLLALWRLQHRPILKVVCPDLNISGKSTGMFSMCSRRLGNQRGNMKADAPFGSMMDNLLYREYLLDRFPNCLSEQKEEKLDYELEYILCGKRSDQANLKATAKKLLLLREGCNYACAAADQTMGTQAGAMAFSIIGWTGIPALTVILKHALLLGWSYGESLVDLRTLFQGGKIPLFKTAQTWSLSLENLGKAAQIVQKGGNSREDGIGYKAHLRILLNMQSISVQKKRGLDLAEMNISSEDGLSNFRADHCVVAVKDKSTWYIPPLFGRAAAALAGTGMEGRKVTVLGGYAYLLK